MPRVDLIWTRPRGGDPTLGPRLPDPSLALAAHEELRASAGYAPTPLILHAGLAKALDVERVYWKDEAHRWGVGSFKGLGGLYATSRLVCDRDRDATTVCCATDGNHGRAVAWAAERLGVRAVVFLPRHASAVRERRIRAHGAQVIRTEGSFDDAVAAAENAAQRLRWVLVSDTSAPGGVDDGALAIAAYTLLMQEIVQELGSAPPPTHIFIQAGVGGLAAAVAWFSRHSWGEGSPAVIVVEPQSAACVGRSLAAGAPVSLQGDLRTVADCLSAGHVSATAWPILRDLIDAAVTVYDSWISDVAHELSRDAFGHPRLEAGPSGVVGLAGALGVATAEGLRQDLRLTSASRVLLIGTEEALDASVESGDDAGPDVTRSDGR